VKRGRRTSFGVTLEKDTLHVTKAAVAFQDTMGAAHLSDRSQRAEEVENPRQD